MGAWGAGVFEDDTSLDWLEGEYASSGADAVARALDEAAGTPVTGYLDYDAGAAARAAAEVVAAVHGNLPEGVETEDLAKLNAHGADVRALGDIGARARAAFQRLISENSELHELWNDGGSDPDWTAAMNDLRRRLPS
ncbi:MAG: DUF4259 domain-containing protein [Maritimibacter sp.]|nr:DUF4259 domain-containing protein [Maritimibacter sp.]